VPSTRPTERILLACSGDLATSVAIPWLRERYGAEVVTMTLDLGQDGALEDVRERALAAGALRAHVIDARDDFAREVILPALHAGALDHAGDPLATPLARLVIVRHLVTTAALENSTAVAHGISDAAGGDSLTRAVRSLNRRLRVLAPAREWRLTRAAQIDYARARGIVVVDPAERPSTISSNLWARSARLVEIGATPISQLARAAAAAPRTAASVSVRFVRGLPVAVNDVELPLVDLISSLATIGGAHGVGREITSGSSASTTGVAVDAPAAAILRAACRELRDAALPVTALRGLSDLAADVVDRILRGHWFTPASETWPQRLTQGRDLTGTVRLELFAGTCRVSDCDVAGRPADSAELTEPYRHAISPPRVAPAGA
jgi:argininosuccinate synthase